jgi:hypothetical protein
VTIHKPSPPTPTPQSGDLIEFNVTALDQAGALITAPLVIRIDAGLSGTVRATNPANFYNGPTKDPAWIGDVEITADGYAPWTTGANPQVMFHDQTINIVATMVPANFRRPAPIARGPLPPFEEPINYRIDLPWEPPAERDYLRADFWGVEIPGAPVVPGGSTREAQRILSWFVDRYEKDFQKRYLSEYAGYGYKHLLLSYADSTAAKEQPSDKPPGAGRTLDQFIETCLFVKKYVKYCHVRIGSKYFQPHFMTAQQWADFADPIMDALIAAKAVDEFSLGWEWNLWNTPGPETINAFRHCGQKARAAGLSSWMHYSPHYTSWQADNDDRGRFGFYDDLQGDVDGLNYQTMGPYWSPASLQARIVDSLWMFGERGNDVKFRMEEDYAAWMWDNDAVTVPVEDVSAAGAFYEYDVIDPGRWGKPPIFRRRPPKNPTPTPHDTTTTKTVPVTPEYANQRGYIGACTVDNVKHGDALVWGFGNGGRRPDGSRL